MEDITQNAIALVMRRNRFYKRNYRMVVVAALISVIILIASIGTIIYMINHPPAPVYFATTNGGKVLQIVPLDQPNLSDSELLQWASISATAAFSYNYINWRKQLQALADEFTPEGWRQFIATLVASNNLEAVKAKQLMVSAVTTGPTVLLKQGLFNGRYTWKVQVPILVTFQGGRNQFAQQALTITMTITRMPTLTSARGVGIMSLVASE